MGFLIAFSLILLACGELFLRLIYGPPHGTFNFLIPGESGLYPENSTTEMLWGPIPYTIRSNSLGFRGREIPFEKEAGRIRIAALGDSITDGFFVDNEDTYPALLEDLLNNKYGCRAEVINAARGGRSIDREYAILREVVISLHPDMALLTFTTNDISDIRGKSRGALLSVSARGRDKAQEAATWLVTKTALGEILYELFLKMRYERYRSAKDLIGKEERYEIEGGDNYEENVKIFNERFNEYDGMVLKEDIDEDVLALIDNYLFVLKDMRDLCRANDIQLVFIYFPAYSQVYDKNTSMKIRDILQSVCDNLSIPFLDLTDAFRKNGKNSVLHLAPVDYHPNPRGNRMMADTIASFLVEGGFIKKEKAGESISN